MDEGTHGEKSLLRLTHGASLPTALIAGEREDALAALAANEQPGGGAQGGGAESSTQLRQRLLGTGPWRIGGVGDVYFLARGVANVGSHVAGTWRVEDGAEGGGRPTVVLSIEKRSLRFRLSCWRLLREDDANIVSGKLNTPSVVVATLLTCKGYWISKCSMTPPLLSAVTSTPYSSDHYPAVWRLRQLSVVSTTAFCRDNNTLV